MIKMSKRSKREISDKIVLTMKYLKNEIFIEPNEQRKRRLKKDLNVYTNLFFITQKFNTI